MKGAVSGCGDSSNRVDAAVSEALARLVVKKRLAVIAY